MRKFYIDVDSRTLIVIDNDEVGLQTVARSLVSSGGRFLEWPHGELESTFITHPKDWFTNKFPNMKLIETQE